MPGAFTGDGWSGGYVSKYLLHAPINSDLETLRARLRAVGRQAGLAARRVDDLVIAVHEAVLHVLDKGAGRGSVHAWQDHHSLTVQVVDEHGLPREESIPEQPSWSDAHNARLWVMRQACDELSIDLRPGLTLVQLRLSLTDNHE